MNQVHTSTAAISHDVAVPALAASTSRRDARALTRVLAVATAAAVSLVMVTTAERIARAESPGPAANPVSVTAKLVEIPTKFPPDDLYDYAYVMRYQVVGGPLDKQFILVAHYKPRQPRAKISDAMKAHVSGKLRSFKTGDVHKLQLTPDLKAIWKGALLDEFAATDRKTVRYWALSADPA